MNDGSNCKSRINVQIVAALLVELLFIQTAAAGVWATNGPMVTARSDHTTTLLQNGKALAAGGGYNDGYFSSTELYDPATATWTASSWMFANRSMHTATLLTNGTVLVAGGLGSGSIYNPIHNWPVIDEYGALNEAELFDSTTLKWTVTGAMASARCSHTATLLLNGNVLVSGGNQNGTNISTAELYNPVTGTWSSTGELTVTRSIHTATLLPNGKVLVAGGAVLSSAELYDPASGTWTPTGSMTTARYFHSATLLPNGKVLVVGGANSAESPLSSAETYDSTTGTWTATGAMSIGRFGHTATLLPNGNVLVTGGGISTGAGFATSTELYQPATGTWVAGRPMSAARGGHTATLLADGTLLIAGGENTIGNVTDPIASTEIYVKSPVIAQRQSNGYISLRSYGSPGESFDFQASTNLQTWQDLGSVAADTNGDVLFDDTNAPNFPMRFYSTIPR